MTLLIKNITLEQQAEKLAQYLPDSKDFQAKNIEGSQLRKVLIGLASEFLRTRNKVNYIYGQHNPLTTEDMLEEWETTVGIPDDCFSRNATVNQRREQVLLKLVGMNATTKEQFIKIADILGYGIQVSNGVDTSTFPLTFPFLFMDEAEKDFIIVIKILSEPKAETFPLTFPFTLNSDFPEILKCLFEKIKPAHTRVYYQYLT
jgi:uncharacterized protein YmfQ (DUF2313 family)